MVDRLEGIGNGGVVLTVTLGGTPGMRSIGEVVLGSLAGGVGKWTCGTVTLVLMTLVEEPP